MPWRFLVFVSLQQKRHAMLAFANCKINLGLNITARRADGYHELETIFYPVKLYDVVELNAAEHTSCHIRGLDIPGNGEDNLCLKAFHLLQKEFNLPEQQITLLKNIPIGAGLGGGSSDAAFLLKLINSKFDLGITETELEQYAGTLGADCPFFIKNKAVYAAGIGDEFAAVNVDLSAYQITIVKPPVHISTAEAYGAVRPAVPPISLKDVINLPVSEWKGKVKNDFESPVFQKYPEIAQIKQMLYDSGATFALMSGSGSSVFGIFENKVRLPALEQNNIVFYTRP